MDDNGRGWGESFGQPEDECEFFAPEVLCVWHCPECHGLVVVAKGERTYPMGTNIPAAEAMPDDAKEAFSEAQQISGVSPRSACAMLRVCVERMVNAKVPGKAPLVNKVEHAELSPSLKKLATACRLVGNQAVHGNEIDFSIENPEAAVIASALSTFANRLADELFGMPQNADDLIAKIEAARKKKP